MILSMGLCYALGLKTNLVPLNSEEKNGSFDDGEIVDWGWLGLGHPRLAG